MSDIFFWHKQNMLNEVNNEQLWYYKMQLLKLRTFENTDNRIIMIISAQMRNQIWQHQKCNKTLTQFLKNNESESDNHFQNVDNKYNKKNKSEKTSFTLLKILNLITYKDDDRVIDHLSDLQQSWDCDVIESLNSFMKNFFSINN